MVRMAINKAIILKCKNKKSKLDKMLTVTGLFVLVNGPNPP